MGNRCPECNEDFGNNRKEFTEHANNVHGGKVAGFIDGMCWLFGIAFSGGSNKSDKDDGRYDSYY